MEKKLEAIKKALELGADIQINFHDLDGEGKEVQSQKMEAVTEILGMSYTVESGDDSSLRWFLASNYPYPIRVAAFYQEGVKKNA